jgi:hypothetical protein
MIWFLCHAHGSMMVGTFKEIEGIHFERSGPGQNDKITGSEEFVPFWTSATLRFFLCRMLSCLALLAACRVVLGA